MAKKKAPSKKKLMPEREVTIKSRAYGEHTRAARGSKTPVGLNEAFAEHNAKTVAVNSVAKRVHDLLKHCGKQFKEAMLWQGMLSRMRKASSVDMVDLLTALKGMELNSKYPLERFMNVPLVDVKIGKKKIVISFCSSMPPHIKSKDTEYCYEVYLLTLGKEAKDDGMMSGVSEWMEKEEASSEMKFEFAVPGKVKYGLVCLHFMSGKDRKAMGTLASRGMRIVAIEKG